MKKSLVNSVDLEFYIVRHCAAKDVMHKFNTSLIRREILRFASYKCVLLVFHPSIYLDLSPVLSIIDSSRANN